MTGIVLAGGSGTRLLPMTKVTNKHLLPVYNKPMIYYPIQTLTRIGCTEIVIITGKEHAGAFLELLGSGQELGIKITYRLQDEAGGIAHALGIAKGLVSGGFPVILGDNIFEDNLQAQWEDFQKLEKDSAMLIAKRVSREEASRFGVIETKDEKVSRVIEKPTIPTSNFIQTGLYFYTDAVFEIISKLKPSKRGELEIADVNDLYAKAGNLYYKIIDGFWSDAGTADSLFNASSWAWAKEHGLPIKKC